MNTTTIVAPTSVPTLGRRFLAMAYEFVLLFGVVAVCTYVFITLTQTKDAAHPHWTQFVVFITAGIYFVWQWRHGGQTLPMQTWRFKIVTINDSKPSIIQCWLRYSLAWIGLFAIGFGFWYAIFDKDRQFLHDRLAKTKLTTQL
jgi:uncharacterized RDD family membrane protein YckC